jgi:hypothetical protein
MTCGAEDGTGKRRNQDDAYLKTGFLRTFNGS